MPLSKLKLRTSLLVYGIAIIWLVTFIYVSNIREKNHRNALITVTTTAFANNLTTLFNVASEQSEVIANHVISDPQVISFTKPKDVMMTVLKEHLNNTLPIQSIILFDKYGIEQYSSQSKNPPLINVADRPYFNELREGKLRTTFGPYMSRNLQKPVFNFAFRLADKSNTFGGVSVHIADLSTLSNVCMRYLTSTITDLAIVNEEGVTLTHCTNTQNQAPVQALEPFFITYKKGALSKIKTTTSYEVHHTQDYSYEISSVNGYPSLRIVAISPEDEFYSKFNHNMVPLLLLTGLLTIALITEVMEAYKRFQRTK